MSDRSVRCERTYLVSATRVFRAWTDPTLITRWWSPAADIAVEVLAWDLRPGGAWRFAYRLPDRQVSHVTGRFLAIDPPRSLAFTWTWEPPDAHAGVETCVAVTLDEHAGATTVQVAHTRFPDEATRDRHDAGWSGTLDRLTEVLR